MNFDIASKLIVRLHVANFNLNFWATWSQFPLEIILVLHFAREFIKLGFAFLSVYKNLRNFLHIRVTLKIFLLF